MKQKEQLTILSITQDIYPEWNALLEKVCDIGRYDSRNTYDIISPKYRIHKSIDHMTWKLLTHMTDAMYAYQGKVQHTVVLLYPLPTPTAVINRIRLQCIVGNKRCSGITWHLIANTTDSGIVSTIPELENCWETFPSSDADREKFLKQFIIKS